MGTYLKYRRIPIILPPTIPKKEAVPLSEAAVEGFQALYGLEEFFEERLDHYLSEFTTQTLSYGRNLLAAMNDTSDRLLDQIPWCQVPLQELGFSNRDIRDLVRGEEVEKEGLWYAITTIPVSVEDPIFARPRPAAFFREFRDLTRKEAKTLFRRKMEAAREKIARLVVRKMRQPLPIKVEPDLEEEDPVVVEKAFLCKDGSKHIFAHILYHRETVLVGKRKRAPGILLELLLGRWTDEEVLALLEQKQRM